MPPPVPERIRSWRRAAPQPTGWLVRFRAHAPDGELDILFRIALGGDARGGLSPYAVLQHRLVAHGHLRAGLVFPAEAAGGDFERIIAGAAVRPGVHRIGLLVGIVG